MSYCAMITGVQGFLGRYVLDHWLCADPTATILGVGRSRLLSRSFTHCVEWNGARLRAPLPEHLRLAAACDRYHYVCMDVRDRSGLANLLSEARPSVILHLAGALRDESASRLFSVNVVGTEALYEAIAQASISPPTVVLGSTGSLYGNVSSERLPIPEEQPPAPFDLYSASKEAAERIARILSARHRIPTIYARIFNVVGPGQDERHLCGWLARQMLAVRDGIQERIQVGPLDTTRDFIDVRDVARALFLLTNKGKAGLVYNVGSGRETSTREIFDSLTDILGFGQELEVSPLPPRSSDCSRLVADISRLRALGFKNDHSLQESLSHLVDYYANIVAPTCRHREMRAVRARTRNSTRSPFCNPLSIPQCRTVRTTRIHRYEVRMVESLLEESLEAVTSHAVERHVLIVSTPTVSKLYAKQLYDSLRHDNPNVAFMVLPCSEATKRVDQVVAVCRAAQRARLDRRALLIAIGGGVVTDIVTVAASWIRRGIEYVRIPTTLIGQVDAGVGIKGAVNLGDKKSYIGVFRAPRTVLIDTRFLKTLPIPYMRYGLSEIIKIALVRDSHLFEMVELHANELLSGKLCGKSGLMNGVVWGSITGMLEELEPNLYENRTYERLVDFGHTFSPALEAASGFRMHHGEAVAIDIALSTSIAAEYGLITTTEFERVVSLLARIGLPTSSPLLTVDCCERSLTEAARHRGGSVNLVVPTAIGAATFLRDRTEIPASVVRRAIEALGERGEHTARRSVGLTQLWSQVEAAGM